MRQFLWWLRSCLCHHEWEYEDRNMVQIIRPFDSLTGRENPDAGEVGREGPMVSATCKRCGWHRSYWKF